MSIRLKKITGIATVLLLGLTACTAHPAQQQHDQSGSIYATQNYNKKTEGSQNPIRSKDRSLHRTVPSVNQQGVHVVADPDSILVLVNKHFKLPDNYVPKQLVYPEVPFISQRSEKSKMRLVAANALTAMFQAAKKDGIQLAGVSAYRSYKTQSELFNYYVGRDGREKALDYSAEPGTSEHETGLAIDVSGIDGKYAATPAFWRTPEAAWLANHAQDYGFIIRYPEGKEAITGYSYEAWHLRYVGLPTSQTIGKRGLTLEEYLGAVAVSR